ncbi:YqzG/YhdC family protein [Sporosarcina sp. UB5]|uniref:YqzG/YhdC family protein n=1 Tax=Sporosarcina sp. UB5 TaxID=3047463 RepID=UPI003D7928DD
MRNLLIALGVLMTVHAALPYTPSITSAQVQEPAYAKWGLLAVKETKQKYPNANVIDYLHIGSETKGDTTIEKFKLWLKDDRHEFGVFVNITFNTKTGQFIKIDFRETDR